MLWNGDKQRVKQYLQQRMERFAQQAVEVAMQEFKTELDYRLETLDRLDAILDLFHKRHQQLPIPEKELSQLVLTWGAYLGTVLQNTYNGHWEQDSLMAGKNTYPLRFTTTEAIPIIWCLRRIRKGEAANILPVIEKFENDLKRVE